MTIPTHLFFDPTFQHLMLQQVLVHKTAALLEEGLPLCRAAILAQSLFPQTETGRSNQERPVFLYAILSP